MRTRTAAGALVTTLLSATVLIVGAAPPAGAHATLTGTVPAADEVVDAVPDVVELQFDEPVETVGGAVEVFGPDGERVDLGSVDTDDGGATLRAPIEGDAIGTYTVAWRVTSEDSHTLTGSFVFHNGGARWADEDRDGLFFKRRDEIEATIRIYDHEGNFVQEFGPSNLVTGYF